MQAKLTNLRQEKDSEIDALKLELKKYVDAQPRIYEPIVSPDQIICEPEKKKGNNQLKKILN